ncbi:MAG: PAS domain-containing protein [Ferruginibacter sp.]
MPVKQHLVTNNLDKAIYKKAYAATPVADTLTNGFFTVDNKWTVKYWNKAAERILHVQAKDIVGKNLWKKFEGIIPIELYAIDQRSFLNDTPTHFHEYWGEMGAWFDVITYHCDNILSVSFKSSKHPHIEYPEDPVKRLKVLTELYRFVTEITNDCLWEWDLQAGDIFWIDGGHKRIFGYQVEDALIPQSFWENCIHPDDRERILNQLNKIRNGENKVLWEEKYRFKTADGSYLYIHDRGHIVYDEKGKAARIIGATADITAIISLENKSELDRLTSQRLVTDAVLTAQEKERVIIATELNENLSQLLVAAKWNIHIAKTDTAKSSLCLDNAVEYVDKVIADIKRIYKTLLIPDRHIFGLFDNIKSLILDMGKIYPITFKFYEGGIDEEEDLDKNLQIDIFRIVQEQLNNIINHAHALRATIKLIKQNNKIILAVSDDGKGCNLLTGKTGVGIINIKSRAGLYNGTVTIASKPGKGYTLKVVFPCITIDP